MLLTLSPQRKFRRPSSCNSTAMMSGSDATMSVVTLCDPSITDGAIKLRVIKTLLRKFRGKIFAKCCGYADTYIDPCC